MPAAKKQSKKQTQTPKCVPDHGDPDRKRVLNIFAQRRYRQRQKKKLSELEAKADGWATSLTTPQSLSLDDIVFTPLESESSLTDANEASSSPCDATVDDQYIPRSTTENVFPIIEYGIETSHDFSTLHTEFHPLVPTPPLPASDTSHSTPPQTPPFAFPLTSDPTHLVFPNFSTFHAFASIASALDLIPNFHNPNYLHLLSPTAAATLPPNLQPTPAQIRIPHHPVLDVLPWPSVREKLICILALPSELRPVIAREDSDEGGSSGQAKAVMQIVHDLDDTAGGCRVHGNVVAWGKESELVEEAWEIVWQYIHLVIYWRRIAPDPESGSKTSRTQSDFYL